MKISHYFKAVAVSVAVLAGSMSTASAVPVLSFLNSGGTSSTTIEVGQTLTLDIWLTGVVDGMLGINGNTIANAGLTGGQVGFNYDTTGAGAITGPASNPITMNGLNTYGMGPASTDMVGGTTNGVNTVDFQFANAIGGTERKGSIKLASIVFTGSQIGTALLAFNPLGFGLTDTNFYHLEGGFNFQDFNFTLDTAAISVVAAVPLPAAVWMLGSGLIGLMGFGRLRRKSSTELAAA